MDIVKPELSVATYHNTSAVNYFIIVISLCKFSAKLGDKIPQTFVTTRFLPQKW